VTMTNGRWRGTGGRIGLLLLAATLVPLPVAAADATTATMTTSNARTSLHQAVAREAARAAVQTPMAPATPTRRADQGSGNGMTHFLKSKPGIIAVSVMAVGTGYAFYSVSHDRIKSPGRQ
jgi:hypothetical protein